MRELKKFTLWKERNFTLNKDGLYNPIIYLGNPYWSARLASELKEQKKYTLDELIKIWDERDILDSRS